MKSNAYKDKIFTDGYGGTDIKYVDRNWIASMFMIYYGAGDLAGKVIAFRLVDDRKKLSAWMNYIYGACMLLAGIFTIIQVCVLNVAFLIVYLVGECEVCINNYHIKRTRVYIYVFFVNLFV